MWICSGFWIMPYSFLKLGLRVFQNVGQTSGRMTSVWVSTLFKFCGRDSEVKRNDGFRPPGSRKFPPVGCNNGACVLLRSQHQKNNVNFCGIFLDRLKRCCSAKLVTTRTLTSQHLFSSLDEKINTSLSRFQFFFPFLYHK